MTRGAKHCGHKNTNIRLKPRTPKTPRPPTKEEVRANNLASVRTSSALTDVRSWVHLIDAELASMNEGKEGRPFLYAQTMIVWIMQMMGYFDLTFRKAAGMAEGIMSSFGRRTPSASSIHRRSERYVMDAVLGAPPEDGRIYCMYVDPVPAERVRRVAVDSTGLNLTQTTLWRKRKWNVGPDYRGWLKLHALTDVDTDEIVAYILTEEDVGDSPMLDRLYRLARDAGHLMSVVYADNAYDSGRHWRMLCDDGVGFMTRFRSNTAVNSLGCMARGRATKLWVENGGDCWAQLTGYGIRWKIECTFSDLKRLISEFVSARHRNGIIRELFAKIRAFNTHKAIRADILGTTGNGIEIARC